MRAVAFLFSLILLTRAAHAQPEAEKQSLKIMTFNVWFGLDGKGTLRIGDHENEAMREKRYQGLVAGIRGYDPDILFIQEANVLPSYARRLAGDAGMDEIHAVNNGGIRAGPVGVPTNLRMGTAILAKPGLGLKKVGTHRTSGAGLITNFLCFQLSEVRLLLAGAVYFNGQPLYLFCLHAHASVPDSGKYRGRLRAILDAEGIGANERERHMNRLAADFAWTAEDMSRSIPYIEEMTRGGKPFVVAGDFNAFSPDFPFLDRFQERLQLTDGFALLHPDQPGSTWDPARNPNTRWDGADTWADGTPKDALDRLMAEFARTVPMRIDYIFLSSRFQREDVISSEVVFAEPYEGVFVSDHFGVMTEILLR